MSFPILPPALALVSSFVAGLTAFGDAILYHALTGIIAAIAGHSEGHDDLALAVVYVTVMTLANMPLVLYVSREQILKCVPYGAAMAVTGLVFVKLGTDLLLYYPDVSLLKVCVGIFFLAFSAVKLCLSMAELGKQRRLMKQGTQLKDGEEGVASVPVPKGLTAATAAAAAAGDPSPLSNGSSDAAFSAAGQVFSAAGAPVGTIAASGDPEQVQEQASPVGTAAAAARGVFPPSPTAEVPLFIEGPSSSKYDKWCPVWIKRVSGLFGITTTMLVLLVTGTLTGLLGGLLGTGGPPQMVAFSLLKVHKDIIRGISCVYTALEVMVRIYAFTTSAGSPFRTEDWGVYAAIAVCSWVGYVAGTAARRKVNTDAIIRMLLVLVFCSSGIMLGALEQKVPAVFFSVFAVGFGLAIALLYFRPPAFMAWAHSMKAQKQAQLRAGSVAAASAATV